MVGLRDLGKMQKSIKITDADGVEKTLQIRPVTAETVFNLIWRFQTFRALMEGNLEGITAAGLMGKLGPMALAAIMVHCTGGCGEPTPEQVKDAGGWDEAKALLQDEAEDIARNHLSADHQAQIMGDVFEMSFKNGVGPFVERIRRLLKSVGPQGLEQAMSLQEDLSSALQMDVHLPTSGTKVREQYRRTLN